MTSRRSDSIKLYLVRHGASSGNTPGKLIGHSGHELTRDGLAQAAAVAARLAKLGAMPIFCSDLLRARQTAEAIWRAQHGLAADGPPVEPELHADARLREIDLGDYEGRSWEEFTRNAELAAAFERNPLTTTIPGGESLEDVRARVLAAVDEIVADASAAPLGGVMAGRSSSVARPGAGRCAILVAHDGPLRALLNHVLGVPPERWWALSTTHGGLSLVEWTDGWANVRFANDTSHLEALALNAVEG